MEIDETLRKADVALDVILKHDEEDSDCSFKQVLAEILERWNKEKLEVESFPAQTIQPQTRHFSREVFLDKR